MNRSTPLSAASVVVLAGIAAALHVAKLPPAVPVLQSALGMDLVAAGFLLSMVQFAGMTLGIFVGLSADGLGLRRSMLVGLSMLTLASVLGGLAPTATVLLCLRAIEGLGFLLVVMPAPALIRRTVDAAHLSARMGLWGAYMPAGSALALLLGPLVLAFCDWPVWWWLLASATAVAALAVWRWVPVLPALPASPGESAGWTQRLWRTLRSRGPLLVSLSFAVYSSQWLAVIGFLPTVYTELGLGAALTGVLTACVALVNVTGNVLSGRLLQKGWPARRLLHIGFTCMALGALGAFGQWDSVALPMPLRFLCVLLFSSLGGLVPGTLFSTAVRLAPDESTVSTTVGYMQQWSALGQFAGPPAVAWVAAAVGGWQWTWAVTVSLCVTGMVLALFIERALRTAQR
jgi:CP family cyanate transporter-like MFS transporter